MKVAIGADGWHREVGGPGVVGPGVVAPLPQELSMDRSALIFGTTVGTVFQILMVLAGHWIESVALLFGPLGMLISFGAGIVYAMRAAHGTRVTALKGGAVVGGACALIGIAVSLALGDVTALILLVGTLTSAAAGAVGGASGDRFAAGARQSAKA
jgi:hypothetical protein